MIFTPYTQPVKPAEWIGTIDLPTYAKGLANKQQMFEESLKTINDDVNRYFNINAQGPDKERLKALQEQLRNELGSVNLSDLTDMGTASRVKSLIRQYGNDPQIQAIAKRSAVYDSEMKRKQQFEDKGETYTSPALETLGNYYNQKNFYEQPKGVNLSNGWTSPPTQKWMKEARESVKKQVLNTKTGVLEDVIDPIEARDYFMQLASSDPRFQKQLNWDFNKKTEGTDWNTEGQNYIAEKTEEARAKITQAKLSGDQDGELLATRELQRLQTMADPSLIGDELRNQYFNSWLQDEMDKVGYSMDQTSFKDYKRDPVYMENLRTQNNITEAKMKAFLDAGYDPVTKQPLVTKDGKPLTEIKQQKEYKPTEKQTIGKRLLQSKTVTNSDIQTLLEKGEYGNLKRDTNGNLIVEYYEEKPMIDPATNQVVYTKTPVRKEPLNQFLQARTNLIEFKDKQYKAQNTTSEEGAPQEQTQSTIKIARPK